jgi:hypothetical protein
MQIPNLHLSAGQLLWVLNRGRPPDARLRNEVRYLRQLGVPHAEDEVSEGRGNRIFYRYEDLIELGVAIHAIRHGLKPRDAASILIKARPDFQDVYRKALEEMPEAALTAEWIKNRGTVGVLFENEIWLRLHDRYSQTPGKFDVASRKASHDPQENEIKKLINLFGVSEQFDDGNERPLIPLTRIAIELTAWALEAPDVRPGRVAQT